MTMIFRRHWFISVVVILIVTGIACLGGCFQVEPPSTLPDTQPDTPPGTSENTLPVIHYMTAQQEVLPSSSSEIRCVATDTDDDTLSYSWSADGGVIAEPQENIFTNLARAKDDLLLGW